MPSVDENIVTWDNYDWHNRGHEWSTPWGNTDRQWEITVHPRIRRALARYPRALEIGPGMGRWTTRLLPDVHHLDVVDVSAKALNGLKILTLSKLLPEIRDKVDVHLGSGSDLPVKDDSIDFVFSFDSLVHADVDVLNAYLMESARVLHETRGLGFIHHANQAGPRHCRGTATADSVLQGCQKAGLHCYSQELTPWVHEQDGLMDCFTYFGKAPGDLYQRVVTDVLAEANYAKKLAALYG